MPKYEIDDDGEITEVEAESADDAVKKHSDKVVFRQPKTKIGKYGKNLGLAFDQLAAAFMGIDHDETISSHLGKAARGDFEMPFWGKPVHGILEKIQPGHSEAAIEEDRGFEEGRIFAPRVKGVSTEPVVPVQKEEEDLRQLYELLGGIPPKEGRLVSR